MNVLYIDSLRQFNAEFPDAMTKEGIDVVHIQFSAFDFNLLHPKHYDALSSAMSVVMDVYVQDHINWLQDVPFEYNLCDTKETADRALVQLKKHIANLDLDIVTCISTGRNNSLDIGFM